MREKKFTPGPWVFEYEGADKYITAQGKSLMCDMDYYPWNSDNEHDWHLIAAAPELLQAARHLLVCARMKWGNLDDGVNGVMDHAEKAIAKAYGEES